MSSFVVVDTVAPKLEHFKVTGNTDTQTFDRALSGEHRGRKGGGQEGLSAPPTSNQGG